jgi:hypothetical protein
MVTTSPPPDRYAAAPVPPPLSAMAQRWSALHQAADVAAILAGLGEETQPREMHDFPAVIHAAGGWRRNLAEQGLADLTAVMEPGLAALLAIHERGADPAVPALALWEEFHAARCALLALLPPPASLPEHSPG